MVPLSATKMTQAFSAVFAVALLFGCRKQPDASHSDTENTPSLKQDVAPTLSPKQPPSIPKLTSSIPQSSAHQPGPADDAKAAMIRVRTRLKEKFKSLSSNLKDIEKLHSAWNETWYTAFDAILESASSPMVASGQVVPPEIMEHIKDTVSSAERFAKDDAEFVNEIGRAHV